MANNDKLTRFPDWQDRLSCYLDRVREDAFVWGEHDCVGFCGGAVKAITGADLIPTEASGYTDKREAALLLRQLKLGTLEGAVTSKLGAPVHVAQAGKGDIVLRNKAVGVCVGRFTWFVGDEVVGYTETGVARHREGLVFWPTLNCDKAWKVAPVTPEAAANG